MGMRTLVIAIFSVTMMTGGALAGPLTSGEAIDEILTERPF